jgi:4-amino-4-deoxy-L-arabinose transferase-like glycosyltransferase
MLPQMKLGRSMSPLVFRTVLFALALLVTVTSAAVRKMPVPAADSLTYLSYARSLFIAGTYAATPEGPQADDRPGREPLYPLLIAGVARLLPTLGTTLVDCDPPNEACQSGFRALPVVNAVLLAGTALLAAIAVEILGGGRLAATLAWAYVAFNLQMQSDLKYVISDYLAVFLVGASSVLLAFAMRGPGKAARWVSVGVALSLLALSKSLFLLFAILVTVLVTMLGIVRWRRLGSRAVLPAILLAVVLVGVHGTWVFRNMSFFGASGDGRGAIALSTREIFDHMTPDEHRAAYLWWLRGPGASLAKATLPEDAWKRHEWYNPDGFYLQGQVTRPQERIDRLMQEDHLSRLAAEARAGRVVLHEIIENWPSYLATMPALFYRGIWFDEFIVLGLPLLIIVVIRAVSTRRWDLLAALSPGLWSLCVYPAVSLNVPRYQLPAVTTLAIAAAFALERVISRCRKRKSVYKIPIT